MAFEETQFLYVVRMDCLNAADEAEFNRWYNEVHCPDVTSRPGILRAHRYKAVWGPDEQSKYLAVYELADEAAIEQATIPNPLSRLPEERRLHLPPGTMHNSSRMIYQRIGPEQEWSSQPPLPFRPGS